MPKRHPDALLAKTMDGTDHHDAHHDDKEDQINDKEVEGVRKRRGKRERGGLAGTGRLVNFCEKIS